MATGDVPGAPRPGTTLEQLHPPGNAPPDTAQPRSRPPRGTFPRRMLALLPLVGAAPAAAVALLGAGLVTLGEASVPAGVLVRGLGWTAFLAAPSAGVPIAGYAVHRAGRARLGIGAVGLILLGGTVTATALCLAFAAR